MNRLTAIRILGEKRRAIAKRSLVRRDEGQSLVEFGLVAPVLLVVLTGIFSFGIILNQYEVLTYATSAGARAFALARNQTTPALAASDPCAYAISILEAAAPNLTASSLNFTIVYTDNSTSTPAVHNYTTSCTDRAGQGNMNAFDQVQITATYPVTPLVFKWTTRSLTMSASSTEAVN